MNRLMKVLVVGTAPAFMGVGAATAPSTQPAPATQPAAGQVSHGQQPSGPLVIPDGTSLQNPGPRPPVFNDGLMEVTDGMRR